MLASEYPTLNCRLAKVLRLQPVAARWPGTSKISAGPFLIGTVGSIETLAPWRSASDTRQRMVHLQFQLWNFSLPTRPILARLSGPVMITRSPTWTSVRRQLTGYSRSDWPSTTKALM